MSPPIANAQPELLELVDFKWLMATDGHSVHLERLQTDHLYAMKCLNAGAVSRCATLRHCAVQLLGRMAAA